MEQRLAFTMLVFAPFFNKLIYLYKTISFRDKVHFLQSVLQVVWFGRTSLLLWTLTNHKSAVATQHNFDLLTIII